MEDIYETLSDDLNASLVTENEELVVVITEIDEMWSYVGNKKNQQWLWLVMDATSRQILAFHVGDRSKKSGETLLKKLPEDFKKKQSFTRTVSQFTTKSYLGNSIDPLVKNLGKQVTLRDLTAPLGNDVHD